jgi:hypothetical protein
VAVTTAVAPAPKTVSTPNAPRRRTEVQSFEGDRNDARSKMSDNAKTVVRSGDFGFVWLIGWMFALGYLKLGVWKAVLGLIIWPYFLGAAFAR